MGKSRLFDEIGNFTTIPNSIMEMMSAMGSDAFALFAYLRFRTNSKTRVAFPSYITIRQGTGLHPRKIALAMRRLEALGVLDRKKRFNGTTIYRLHLPQNHKTATSASNSNGGTTGSSNGGTTGSSNGGTNNKTDINKTDINQTDSPAAKAAGQPAMAQKRRYAARKVPPQIAAYREVCHRYPNKALYGDIVAAVPETDIEFYKSVLKAWVAIGWNPANIAGQLDVYKRREIPNHHKGQSHEKPIKRTRQYTDEDYKLAALINAAHGTGGEAARGA